MSGESFDYAYGRKAQWRREMWNTICARLLVPPCNAVVLYLAGEQDLDREVALRKGFKPDNMIAIERDSKTLKSLRSRGVLAIDGDVVNVVRGWPRDKHVDVIYADFCSDLCEANGPLIGGLPNKAFEGAVVALNFMRGRGVKSGKNAAKIGQKHRGWHALLQYAFVLNKWCGFSDEELLPGGEARMAMGEHFMSYWSVAGRAYFDSVVFNNLATDDGTDNEKGNPIRRKIAAIMAHRTMRGHI